MARYVTPLPGTVLFWAAYVLTRPLGATLGDTLTKPPAEGGVGLSRIGCTFAIAAAMVVLITVTSLRKRQIARSPELFERCSRLRGAD
jgi:uncharacterized membrane-anchored protein